MARRTFEMSFQIGGRLDSSFSSSFSGATNRLTDLRNQARQTQRALDQLGNDFRNGRIHQDQYAESTQRLTRQLARLETVQRGIRGIQSGLNQGINTAKSVASMAALGASAAATGIAIDSLSKAGSFEQQMTKVGVIAGASETEMKKLNNTALELGANTSLSASEVAVAMGELAAKGMNTNKIIGSMPGILAAAEASGEDLAMTSDVVTSALNAFGLKSTQASHIADVMAMSANKTAAGVEDLGYSFKYAAPVANTLGISLEELAASTGLMVDKGLSGEQAGTSLRMALIRLSSPPKKAKKALDNLNLSVTDSEGKFKSLTKLSGDWNEATKDLSDTQKVQYASTVFGVEAATGMLNLFASGTEKIDSLTKSLEGSTGAAKEAADAMKDNYAGALEQLKGSIESAQIKFMTPVLPIFQDLFSGVISTLDGNSGNIEKSGQKLANGLKDIFDPFSTQKPVKPKLEEGGSLKQYDEQMAKYEEQLAKYNKFKPMDFGDKVVYMLDEATAKASTWLDGSGGESMNKIFTKLGEIAAKAWYNAFTGALKASASNLGEGNIASGIGAGAAAWMLGGGLLVKGAVSAGKMAKGAISARRGASTTPVSTVARTGSRAASTAATTSRAASGVGTASRVGSVVSKAGKVAGKVALPATIALEAYNIYKSKDKVKSTVTAGSGIAGSLGGAKIGAAIGTAIAPGIGTAIGGLIGGLGGYAAGKWLGGKAVDTARQTANPVPKTTTSAVATTPVQNNAASQASMAALNQSTTQLNAAVTVTTNNFKILSSYAGQASGWLVGSFTGIQSSAALVKHNLDLLVSYAGQASGWLASLSNIPSASQRVETALNNLATRINNVQVPSSVGGNKRVEMK